jgi:hypothetical protein
MAMSVKLIGVPPSVTAPILLIKAPVAGFIVINSAGLALLITLKPYKVLPTKPIPVMPLPGIGVPNTVLPAVAGLTDISAPASVAPTPAPPLPASKPPAILPVITIGVIADPEHIVCEAGVAVAVGIGLTTTVAVIGVPGQPLAVGVMVKVTVTGAVVVLVNAPLILPAPAAAMPVTATLLSLTQLYTVPATLPVMAIVVMVAPEQIVCAVGAATALGVGLTKTVAVTGVPGQPLAVGVIVNVTVIGEVVVLVSVPLILPAPLAAIPVTVATLSLVQLYTTPATALPLITIVVIGVAEHIVWLAGVATAVGVGFTVIVKVIGVPVQVVPALV